MSCEYTYKSNIYTESEIKDLILEQEVLKNNPIVTFTKKIFKTLPYQYKEDLLNEGSKKYGIARGKSTATVRYSQADQNKVDFGLKAVEILQSDKARQIFEKGKKANWSLDKILTELQISKEQKQLILDLNLESKKPDVILPIGTSGSGKSTFIKSLPQENLVVIEPDAMRVEFTGDINNKTKDKEIYEEAAKRAVAAIKQGKQVVFDTTNLTKDKRLPFIEAIKKEIPTANIQYKLMELNPELAKQRIKAQIARGENRANVPDSTIDRHAESYKQMLEDIKSEPISNFEKNIREEIITDLLANYSYTTRLNTPNGKIEYTGDLAIEEKMAEEAFNSKDEKVPTTLIGKFIQSVRNLLRNIFKERDRISRLIRDLNQGKIGNTEKLLEDENFIDNEEKIALDEYNVKYQENYNDIPTTVEKTDNQFNNNLQFKQDIENKPKNKKYLEDLYNSTFELPNKNIEDLINKCK